MLPSSTGLHVVKRDGSQETFNIDKLTHALAGALADAEEDVACARPLAEATAWHLWQSGQAEVRADDLAYQVQRALEQIGHSRAADCYAHEAICRQAARSRLRIRAGTGLAKRPQRWDRRRWMQHVSQLGVSANQARTLVNRVERQLLRLGLDQVSEVLISELLACEHAKDWAPRV